MKDLSRNVLFAVAIAAAVLVPGPQVASADEEAAAESRGRQIDLEAGIGYMWRWSDDLELDHNIAYGASIVVELSERVHFELDYTRTDTHVRDDVPVIGSNGRSVDWWTTALRLYPRSKHDDRVRPYLLAGVTRFDGYERGKNDMGFIFGPGLRLRAGDHTGFTLSAPLVTAMNGSNRTVMLPMFNLFWQFDMKGGALKAQ